MVKGRQRDARRAGWLGWASVLAVALTLTACPAPPTSPPLTASQRVELRPSDAVHLSLLLDEYVLWQAEGFEVSFTGAPLAEAAIDVTGIAWRASVGCGGNAGVPAFHSEADLDLVVD